jgi:hypothetical protein
MNFMGATCNGDMSGQHLLEDVIFGIRKKPLMGLICVSENLASRFHLPPSTLLCSIFHAFKQAGQEQTHRTVTDLRKRVALDPPVYSGKWKPRCLSLLSESNGTDLAMRILWS